jgi:hypothetical protein
MVGNFHGCFEIIAPCHVLLLTLEQDIIDRLPVFALCDGQYVCALLKPRLF